MGLTFDEMFPSRFFKADDVEPPLVLKIREVTLEALDGEDKKKKPVVYFVRQDKALALNKTNAAALLPLRAQTIRTIGSAQLLNSTATPSCFTASPPRA